MRSAASSSGRPDLLQEVESGLLPPWNDLQEQWKKVAVATGCWRRKTIYLPKFSMVLVVVAMVVVVVASGDAGVQGPRQC